MLPLLIVIGVIVLLVLVLGGWFFGMYNGLVRRRIASETAWSDIDVQLKRRHDLVPNLVNTVKGYASHEKETLENVIKARSQAVDANGPAASAQAEGMLSSALGKIFALSEAYPDLKANQNFLALQEELTSTENKIGFARTHYNRTTASYNEALQTIPTNIVAGMFSFQKRDLFELEDAAERNVPQVQF
ncbi:MAG: LemA family protein [Phycisphaerales bacterium]|nr:LemA family protein [Phycisphaerales bacterium]